MFKVADRVKQTTTTQGSGNITLQGYFGGFQTFESAIGDGNSTYYTIENNSQFEVGIGTFSGGVLYRDTIFSSSNNNQPINLNGVSIVFCTYPADMAVFNDDYRLYDTRDPNLHTHPISGIVGLQTALDGKQPSGSYALSSHSHYSTDILDFSVAVSAVAPPTTDASLLTTGTLDDNRLSNNVVLTTDSRLSDSRDPNPHTHNSSDIVDFALAVSGYAPPTIDASLLTTGTLDDARLSNNVVFTNDSRLSDSRYPLYHLHNIVDISGLQSAIDGKQPSGNYANSIHTHTSSSITDFNTSVSGLIDGIYAPLYSPHLTGIPLTPTANSGTNTNQIASTSFVRTEISNLVASAPSTLDTLNELALALGNDQNFATTITNSLSSKANLSGATFTGSISSPSGSFTSLLVNSTSVSLSGHTHSISDISNLQNSLDNKQPSGSYANLIHNHTSSNITDFNSSVSGLLPVKNILAGSGIGISSNAENFTVSVTGNFGLTSEEVDDRVSNLLVGGSYINLDYIDSGNSLTISVTGLQPIGNYSISGHLHSSTDITDFDTSVSGLIFHIGTVDLHNGGVQNAQIIQFGDTNYQSIITGPTPASGINSQRIIIQGQRAQGSAEGGDVYLWGGDSDVNGGDIKIYAGDADSSELGNGGYINVTAGYGFNYGGNLELEAGNSSTNGGNIDIRGGGGSNPGFVRITTGGSYPWLFGSDGNLNLPQGKTVNWGQNVNTLGPPVAGGATDRIRLWDFGGEGSNFNYAIGAEGNHVWFAMDVNDGTGGFKFYSRDNVVLKISDDSKIVFPNNTTIATGTYDNSTGGYGGISLNCVVGYELNWQGGHLKSTYDNGSYTANILCDSPIEFPGIGVANLQIDNSGITFSDGSYLSSANHNHQISNIDLLQDVLDSKQPSGNYATQNHNHVIADVSGLQTALDGKQPSGNYAILPTGGTINQILSKVNSTSYDLQWIDNYATELSVYVKNTTGSNLSKGQAVYINGAQGNNPTITLALASGETSSSKTVGLLKQDLAINSFGYVVCEGILDNVDTSSASQDGDTMWLSPTVSGGIVYGTSNKPLAPYHMVFLGYVLRKQLNNGRVFVKIQNGFELGELHNVSVNGTSGGKFLQYNDASGLWLASSSGNFTSLQLNGTNVSVAGHTHTSSDISNFNTSVSGLVSGIYAPLSSPTLTGVPLTPTAASGTNTNQIASTSFVRTEISNLVASAPSTLDTLNELASALGNDANFSTTITNNLANKANLSGATFTGSISSPSGSFTQSLQLNGTGVSVNGHTHTASNITDFNSSVSGLLPVKNLTAGSYIQVSSTTGNYTIDATGLQPAGSYASSSHTHTSSNITDFNSSVSGLLPVKNIVAGSNITVTSSSGTYTINSTGGGSTQFYEYTSVSGFPSSGTSSTVYLSTDSRRLYSWTGSTYAEIGAVSVYDSRWNAFLPGSVTSLSGSAGNNQVVLSWTAPTGVASQTPITDYSIQYSSDSGVTWSTFSHTPSSSTSSTVTGLTNGTSYLFNVAGVNVVGTGNYTTSSSISPAAVISINYLAIGGGGAGGGNTGGGGGAGQVLSGSSTMAVGTTYTVVVGSGGTGTTGNGNNGTASTVNGGSISLSAAGGGGGGGILTSSSPSDKNGASVTGGSGGGGGGAGNDGAGGGAGGTGTYNGGNSGTSPSSCLRTGGGGGGSSANGTNAAGYTAGSGGNGTVSTITGSSVTYAGGGGGGSINGPFYGCTTHTLGSAGSGGGGAGSLTGNGTAGTANTGSGGGGGGYTPTSIYYGGNGGTGVVIIRLIGAAASSTTGSPTVTQVGSDYVYTFTGNGSITP